MSDLWANARLMVQLFERVRGRPGPAFDQLKRLNLSFSHLRALRLLEADRVLTMKELAEQLEITPPSVTTLTRRLVELGLVERRPHAEDSRVVLVALTTAGRDLHARLTEEHVGRMAELLRGLSPEEQQQFLSLLERAVTAMHQASDAPPAPDHGGDENNTPA